MLEKEQWNNWTCWQADCACRVVVCMCSCVCVCGRQFWYKGVILQHLSLSCQTEAVGRSRPDVFPPSPPHTLPWQLALIPQCMLTFCVLLAVYIACPSGSSDQCSVCFFWLLKSQEQLVLNRTKSDLMLESLKIEAITKTKNSFYRFRESTLLPTLGSDNRSHQLRQTDRSLPFF